MPKNYDNFIKFIRLALSLLVLFFSFSKITIATAAANPAKPTNCLYIIGATYKKSSSSQEVLLSKVNWSGFLDVTTRAFVNTTIDLRKLSGPTMVGTDLATRSDKYTSYTWHVMYQDIQFIQSVDGKDKVQLPYPSAAEGAKVYWSSDGKHIAYPAYTADGKAQLGVVIADADGQNSKVIRFERNFPQLGYFDWSPDGAYVLVGDSERADSYLTFISADDYHQQTFVSHDNTLTNIAWTPHGHQFAYAWDGNLTLINPDKAAEQIFSVPAVQSSDIVQITDMVWSPDGRHLVAASYSPEEAAKSLRLDVFGMDGSWLVNVGRMGFNLGLPAWSSDGKALIFRQPNQNTLLAYYLSDRHYETLAVGAVGFVSETPDDQSVVFEQRQNERDALNLLRIADKHITPLVEDLDEVVSLDWLFDNKAIVAVTRQGSTYSVDMVQIDTLSHYRLLNGLIERAWLDYPSLELNPGQIAFWWRSANGEAGIDSYDLAGKRIFRLKVDTPNILPVVSGAKIYWSPDHRVAALALADNNTLQLASSDGQSSIGIGHFTNVPLLVWSPDSSKLAFVQTDGADDQSVNVSGSNGPTILSFHRFDAYNYLQWVQCPVVF